jgi:aldose 1-epimerase
MSFFVTTQAQENQIGLDPTLYQLGQTGTGHLAVIWPALGFNCLTWRVPHAGQTLDLLYLDPGQFSNGRPTRSGIPVLFPFPNRVRGGRFSWNGRDYQLPRNDGAKANAIHGFACRHPWRVIAQGADDSEAWLTGEFQCSADGPASLSLWPADHRIRLTYRLREGALRLEAEVSNPDREPLPFGLGYHPYFRMPFVAGASAEACAEQVPARHYWELLDSLPTGERRAVDAVRDLNSPRPFAQLQVDDVLTDLPGCSGAPAELRPCASLFSPPGATLRLSCSPDFREMVIFTPPHRQAFCVEPYTCTTDAINLEQRGIDAGLRVLAPGETWAGVIQFVLEV